jgi:hypothetical protein
VQGVLTIPPHAHIAIKKLPLNGGRRKGLKRTLGAYCAGHGQFKLPKAVPKPGEDVPLTVEVPLYSTISDSEGLSPEYVHPLSCVAFQEPVMIRVRNPQRKSVSKAKPLAVGGLAVPKGQTVASWLPSFANTTNSLFGQIFPGESLSTEACSEHSRALLPARFWGIPEGQDLDTWQDVVLNIDDHLSRDEIDEYRDAYYKIFGVGRVIHHTISEQFVEDTTGAVFCPPHIQVAAGYRDTFGPPKVQVDWSDSKRAQFLARAYKTGVVSQYSGNLQRIFGSLKGPEVNRLLVRASRVLEDLEISPGTWVWWSCRVFAALGAKRAAKLETGGDSPLDTSSERVFSSPPPLKWVFSEMRMRNHCGWFWGDTKGSFKKQPMLFGPTQWTWSRFGMFTSYRIRFYILSRTKKWWLPDYTKLIFPGGWRVWFDLIREENDKLHGVVSELREQGEWLW